MLFRLFLLSCLLLLLPVPAGAANKKSQSKTFQYKTVENVLYREADSLTDYQKERCRLDVYYPVDRKNFSTVVWFHGGGLKAGKRDLPDGLKDQGVAIVAVNYRLHPKVKSPAYVEDAAASVAWVFEHIHEYGGDSKRIFVSGHSAGGYLASMVGLDKRWLAKHKIDANRIAGLIPYSGHTITHFTVRKELGIDGKQPIIDDMAPLFHVRKDSSPILFITGDREMEILGRYEENAYMWRMMQVVEHPDAELFELEGFDHGGMAKPAHHLLLKFVDKHSKLISLRSPKIEAITN